MKTSSRLIQLVFIILMSILVGLLFVQPVHAEGSRNLTNNGGYRAWLQYSGDGTTTAGVLRDNLLKVYVNEGETIYLGSSAIGIGAGDIRWTAPNGATGQCSTQGTGVGRIENRAQEVAGPAPLTAGGYTPCTLTVGSGQMGIWLITFTAPAVGGGNPPSVLVDAAWTQPNDVSAIAAWDITVVGTDNLEKTGRAYASYLPFTLSRFERSFFAEVFVLTRDGYQYRWDLNGIQPTTFILFSNKKGFKLTATDEPSYDSVPLIGGEVNNLLPPEYELNAPDDPDIGTDVTYKTFFNIPNPDLPLTATRPSTVTWLLRPPVPPIAVSNLVFTPAIPGSGGTFTFEANGDGRYQLFVDTNNDGLFGLEADVVLTGNAVLGMNTVIWNGNDPNGNPVDTNVCYQVLARGIAGEIHFPIYDAERNPNGMIMERLNGATPGDYTVYYNDIPIGGAQARAGEDSRNGAHVWTTVPGGDPSGFGNQRGIDTWTYAIGENTAATLACDAANLIATKRDSLLIDVNNNGVANPGDRLRYEIIIQNTGAVPVTNAMFNDTPDFNTTLVVGSVTTSQGTVTIGNIAGDSIVQIDIGTIPGSGSVAIQFDVLIVTPLPTGVTQVENQGFISTTELPNTPTDDPDTPTPDDPTVTPVVAAPILDALKTDTFAIDQDGDGNISPGDRLEYEITIANTGNTTATNVIFNDTPGQYTTLVTGTVQTSQGAVELGNNAGDTTVRVNIGAIAAGASVTVRFRVDIDATLPSGVTQVENQGFFTSDQLPPVPTDDPDTPITDDPTMTPVVAAPLLDAFKEDSLLIDADGGGFVSPGDTLIYHITILNQGNTAAIGVTFSDTPDSNTTLVAGSVRTDQGTVTVGNTAGDTTVSIDIGDIASGAEIRISFQVTINNPLPDDVTQVANQGIIRMTTITETVPTDDPETPIIDDPTITPVGEAQLIIVKSSDPASGEIVSPNDTITYRLTVTNTGFVTLTGVVISDTIPTGATYVVDSASPIPSSGPDPLVWNVPSLSIGQGTTVSFVVRVNDVPADTVIRNVALVQSDQTPPTTSNEVTHLVTGPTSLPETEEPLPNRVLLPMIWR